MLLWLGADQRKHQSPASLDFVRGIHRWPVNFPHTGSVTPKMFPFDQVVMCTLRNKLHWNFNRSSKIFIQENALANVVWEMASILSRSQCVKQHDGDYYTELSGFFNNLAVKLVKMSFSNFTHISCFLMLVWNHSSSNRLRSHIHMYFISYA